MSKGEQRSNKEVRKPKADKNKPAKTPAAAVAGKPATFGGETKKK